MTLQFQIRAPYSPVLGKGQGLLQARDTLVL